MPALLVALCLILLQTPEEDVPRPLAPAARGGEPLAQRPASMVEPKPLKRPKPDYPEEARRAGLEEPVISEANIDAEGRVTESKVLRGDSPLAEAAIEAVKKWRYKPLKIDGTASAFVLTVTLNFDSRVYGERRFRFEDLTSSLRSEYEAVRESAARWLGRLRGQMNARSLYVASRELRSLLEHEQSERVRAATMAALAELERNQSGLP